MECGNFAACNAFMTQLTICYRVRYVDHTTDIRSERLTRSDHAKSTEDHRHDVASSELDPGLPALNGTGFLRYCWRLA